MCLAEKREIQVIQNAKFSKRLRNLSVPKYANLKIAQ